MSEAGVPQGAAPLPLRANGVRKSYRLGDGSELEVLRGVDLAVLEGEAVAVVGTSGVGKSTLLQLLGALDLPTAGEIELGGQPIAGLSSLELAQARNRYVGFVFQFHHLLREFSALENVMMPRLIRGTPRAEAEGRAMELLQAVGLGGRLAHRPWQLSGGEQQRVAVARALANEPKVLLADEPSGNLDPRTSGGLHDLLFQLRDERRISMVLVTHNLDLAARADRTLYLREGVLSEG
ncbi:MAG: ABC transporter ATP-binding protein [Gemmatimonadetes bacterium]|nr:ABC transporter ATP-binding protein [Gemmatimonadota bacterium]